MIHDKNLRRSQLVTYLWRSLVATMGERLEGIVKFFSTTKGIQKELTVIGYGFIVTDGLESDVFVHHSAIINEKGFR